MRSVQSRHLVDRLLVGFWLVVSPRSWQRTFAAADASHVRSSGKNPDHVLLIGDGVATGRGVVSHDLALSGHLARSLSARTGHATDVDIAVDPSMTARSCVAVMKATDLSKFDLVVVSVGYNEALSFLGEGQWQKNLDMLLSQIELSTLPDTRVFILAIPTFEERTALPAHLARTVDAHTRRLNAVTARLVSRRPNMTVIALSADNQFEPENAQVYGKWAESIATQITGIPGAEHRPVNRWTFYEAARQRAVEELADAGNDVDRVLQSLTELARQTFGTALAAITIIHRDTQEMRVVSGMDPLTLPRDQAICNTTIRLESRLVVEDTHADPRFSDYDVVVGAPGVRFYAGCPIESPDGYRVGALCVMDTQPRHFTESDLEILGDLARIAQAHLWKPIAS